MPVRLWEGNHIVKTYHDRIWRATVCFKGKRYYLGRCRSLEEAAKAGKRAKEKPHENFLRKFANEQVRNTGCTQEQNAG